MPTIVVFSHLRWDFVFQRPQHLLSRLAQHYPVLFVEEPVHEAGSAFMERSSPAPNVTVCRAHTPIQAPGFHDEQLRVLQTMVGALAPPGEEVIAWFYTPMALPLLQALQPALVVYDCMDELASFKNPPKQLLQRESALLNIADLVFAGGPSLYEAKKHRHPNVHCFPSSVDVLHFQQALDRSRVHPQQAAIGHPRLGFYGVLDERFDPELVGKVADAHPEWQIVLAGPVVKIDPARLPHKPNIHYLGQQPYARLPDLLAGWDVCLMPFAINDATKFISPTKVLEYIAAQLPIVSTPIADVVKPYGHLVAIADGADAFVAACEAALALAPAQRATMVAAMSAIAATTSWDNTATQMRALLDAAPSHAERRTVLRGAAAGIEAAQAGETAAAADQGLATAPAGARAPSKVNPLRAHEPQVGTVVIGAGPGGLSAAWHLGADALLLDRREAVVGGLAADVADAMLPKDPAVLKIVEALLGEGSERQHRPVSLRMLVKAFAQHIKGKIELSADVVKLLPRERIVALRDGRRFRYDDLISTIPLAELIKAIGTEAPEELRQAVRIADGAQGVRQAALWSNWLKGYDIHLAGGARRQEGDAAHALLAGKRAADIVLARHAGAQKAGAE